MRHTARAIIIKDQKILMLTGHDAGHYWTPGGGLDDGETSLQALHREVMEELSVTINHARPYMSYQFEDQTADCFIVDINDSFTIANEITDAIWYAKNDEPKLSRGFEAILLPQLIADELL